MKQISLASGDKMPALGLGTWKMSDGVGNEAVRTAIENGYRHIDCAWIYENETDVGQAISDCLEQGVVKRDELWVTSKLWNDRHRGEHVAGALKESLEALKLDYLDLYLMHWPVAQEYGMARPENGKQYLSLEQVPLEETWQAMLDCVATGTVRNVGVSNFSKPKLAHLIDKTGNAPACNQVESHPFLPQTDLFNYCQEQNIAYTAYSPLGSGDRPDAMKTKNEPSLLQNDVIESIAGSRKVSPAQILLAWAVQRGSVPIPKSANAERQKQNLQAAELDLSDDDMQAIADLDRAFRYVDGKFWEVPEGPYTAKGVWDE